MNIVRAAIAARIAQGKIPVSLLAYDDETGVLDIAVARALAGRANLWRNGDVTVSERNLRLALTRPLEAGNYRMWADVDSTDTDTTTCLIFFHNGNVNTPTSANIYLPRNSSAYTDFTINSRSGQIALYTASTYGLSSGDTATFANIRIVHRSAS